MKIKVYLAIGLMLLPFLGFSFNYKVDDVLKNLNNTKNQVLPAKEVLASALAGFNYLKSNHLLKNSKNLVTVIDFSLPSTKKRLWVIDLDKYKVLFYSYVAHGKNTGENVAKTFSNVPNSLQSSLGFYVTGDTYVGKHGLSLRLNGVEKDINDNAFDRAIVMHGADYVSEDFIKKYGRLGRSFGCPAISNVICKKVVEAIGDGTCLFIYYPDEDYLKNSLVLNGANHQTDQLTASEHSMH